MFEYISGKSIVHLLDPRTKILFLLIITILAVLIRDPVSLLFLFLATVIPLLLAGIHFGQLKKILLLYTLIVIGL
jgi:energy-coupling factor transporter transmembrane protein EcfT